jgi:hypothetical protein
MNKEQHLKQIIYTRATPADGPGLKSDMFTGPRDTLWTGFPGIGHLPLPVGALFG